LAARIHRPLKITEFNANGIWRKRYELSKQLQDLHIDMALLSETPLKPHEKFYIPKYHFYHTEHFPGSKGGTAVAIREDIPHNHVDLQRTVSAEAKGLCIPIGNSKVLLAAVYKSPCRTWNNTDIIGLLSFRGKYILAGDLNAKHPFWNRIFFSPSGVKLPNLLHINEFEISASQCPTHYSSTGNGGMPDIVVHKNVQMSEVIVSDILDSDHVPIIFYLLDLIRSRNLSNPFDKFTDWERFKRLASELIAPKIQINSEEEANKAAREFTATIALAYKMGTRKITLSDINKDIYLVWKIC
jgi:hypothetical protein